MRVVFSGRALRPRRHAVPAKIPTTGYDGIGRARGDVGADGISAAVGDGADGPVIQQAYPNGLQATTSYDETGDPTRNV